MARLRKRRRLLRCLSHVLPLLDLCELILKFLPWGERLTLTAPMIEGETVVGSTLAAAFDPSDGTLVVARRNTSGELLRFSRNGVFIARHTSTQTCQLAKVFAIWRLAIASDGSLFMGIGRRWGVVTDSQPWLKMASRDFTKYWTHEAPKPFHDLAICESASVHCVAMLNSEGVTLLDLNTGHFCSTHKVAGGVSLAFDPVTNSLAILQCGSDGNTGMPRIRLDGNFGRAAGRLTYSSVASIERGHLLRRGATPAGLNCWYVCSDHGVHTYDDNGAHIARVAKHGFVALDILGGGRMHLSRGCAFARYLDVVDDTH